MHPKFDKKTKKLGTVVLLRAERVKGRPLVTEHWLTWLRLCLSSTAQQPYNAINKKWRVFRMGCNTLSYLSNCSHLSLLNPLPTCGAMLDRRKVSSHMSWFLPGFVRYSRVGRYFVLKFHNLHLIDIRLSFCNNKICCGLADYFFLLWTTMENKLN